MRSAGAALALALLYLGLALAFTWPAPAALSTRLLGAPGDNQQNVWNIWWTHRAVFERGVSPYHTDLLHHPEGASLRLHTLSELNVAVAAPLVPGVPLAWLYNGLIYAHIVGAGVAMAWLARDLLGGEDWAAPFVAGAVFTFSSYHVGHASQMNLAATAVLPLIALAMVRGARAERPLGAALATAAALVAAGLYSWYNLVFGGCLAATLAAVLAWREPAARTRRHALALAAALVLPLVLLSPWIAAMLAAAREPQQNVHDPGGFSADLLAYFVPGPFSSFGAPFRPLIERFSGNAYELTQFAGPLALALAALGLRPAGRARAPLLAILGTGFVLSLGPALRVAGVETGIPLPYAALERALPPFRMAGVPMRFSVLCDLAIAGLAGFGALRLLAAAGEGRGARVAAAGLLVALRLAEQSALPFPTATAVTPALYRTIAADARPTAVLDLATIEDQAEPLLHQTVHGHPILGGYLARTPRSKVRLLSENPVVRRLILRTRADEAVRDGARPEEIRPLLDLSPEEKDRERARPSLRDLGVAWVVTVEPLARALCEELGYERVAVEGPRTLFRVY